MKCLFCGQSAFAALTLYIDVKGLKAILPACKTCQRDVERNGVVTQAMVDGVEADCKTATWGEVFESMAEQGTTNGIRTVHRGTEVSEKSMALFSRSDLLKRGQYWSPERRSTPTFQLEFGLLNNVFYYLIGNRKVKGKNKLTGNENSA